jgi:hypothetical protein
MPANDTATFRYLRERSDLPRAAFLAAVVTVLAERPGDELTPAGWLNAAEVVVGDLRYARQLEAAANHGYSCLLEYELAGEAAREQADRPFSC